MKVEDFYSKSKEDIETKLEEIIKGQPEYEKLKYALSGGKRLRSSLNLLVFNVCKEKTSNKALETAAAIELMHSASLVHDDIIDQDLLRRGGAAVYRKYGVEDAVLLGHRMVSLGFKIAACHSMNILETFIRAWDSAIRGELMELELSKKQINELISGGRELYFEVISDKTASLFAASCSLGAQEAGAGEELKNLLEDYGELIGIIHQLADDYTELKKGCIELLPLLGLMSHKDDFMFALTRAIKKDGRAAMIQVLEESRIDKEFKFEIEKAVSKAESLSKDSRIPNSPCKEILIETPRYVVSCMLAEIGEQWSHEIISHSSR